MKDNQIEIKIDKNETSIDKGQYSSPNLVIYGGIQKLTRTTTTLTNLHEIDSVTDPNTGDQIFYTTH